MGATQTWGLIILGYEKQTYIHGPNMLRARDAEGWPGTFHPTGSVDEAEGK